MNNIILIIVFLLAIIITGFINILYKIYKKDQDYSFVADYSSKLNKLIGNKISNEDYSYILSNATKLSKALGVYGVMDYQPPFANYIHKNYNLINFVLNYSGEIMNEEIQLFLRTIIMYLGACNNYIDSLKTKLKNPFVLFAEGFRFIFNIPLFILKSLGVISDNIYYRVKGNIVYHFFQNIIGLIGLVSSVIGIVQGKDVLVHLYSKLIGMFS